MDATPVSENVLEIKLENDMPEIMNEILNKVNKLGKTVSKYRRSRLLLTAI
ncbi:hypothetical protein [Clostridium perfringens]|uniref:hypothetical protein n=1 Tax=Clostridium perfringens TaxID=1502 RepID=UPI0024BC4D36|nr:hypothetical protein [Clostridium perfringens]